MDNRCLLWLETRLVGVVVADQQTKTMSWNGFTVSQSFSHYTCSLDALLIQTFSLVQLSFWGYHAPLSGLFHVKSFCSRTWLKGIIILSLGTNKQYSPITWENWRNKNNQEHQHKYNWLWFGLVGVQLLTSTMTPFYIGVSKIHAAIIKY